MPDLPRQGPYRDHRDLRRALQLPQARCTHLLRQYHLARQRREIPASAATRAIGRPSRTAAPAFAAISRDMPIFPRSSVPTTAGRAAAIRQHVLEMPAPVVADALGYHHVTTTKLASEAGGTWSRYAPGDHTRSPEGWGPRGTGDS